MKQHCAAAKIPRPEGQRRIKKRKNNAALIAIEHVLACFPISKVQHESPTLAACTRRRAGARTGAYSPARRPKKKKKKGQGVDCDRTCPCLFLILFSYPDQQSSA